MESEQPWAELNPSYTTAPLSHREDKKSAETTSIVSGFLKLRDLSLSIATLSFLF